MFYLSVNIINGKKIIKMNTTNFSKDVLEVLGFSNEEARRLGNAIIDPEHLLLGILREKNSKALLYLNKLDVDLSFVKQSIEKQIRQDKMIQDPVNLPYSPSTERILKMGFLEAQGMKSDVIDTEHLLLAILKENDNLAANVLKNEGIQWDVLRKLFYEKNYPVSGPEFTDEEDDEMDEYGLGNKPDIWQKTQERPGAGRDTPALDNFGNDLTKAALEGRLDPIIGREKETLRLAQILSRRKKNNPVLIGEPGVGKSAIVEGLALRIVQRKVSRILFDKRVVSLDLASMVAGTKYRGQFEERIKAVLNELQQNPDIILFIDEIHTMVGAGNASGSMDAANMLKPALARGEIQCIGATTLDEYRKSIEKDGALERRFQKIIVDATTPDETYQILINIKDRYEEHHNVHYSDEALKACVQLTNRYISDRNFPDKAIDAMDEAGSRVHISNIQVPESIELLEKEMDESNRLKVEAVNAQNFELAAEFRDKNKEQQKKLAALKTDWEAKLTENKQPVDEEKIAEVVSMMSGVPLQRIAQEEGSKLLKMKDELKSRIIGQDAAVEAVVKAIQRNRVGLKDPNKPIGTFLFVGPTGVGKTHLAKLLSEAMFDTSDALIRIDMSEFMEKFTVSRLVGAPPGYVGYEEGGQLTEKVRRKPYSVLLLDEIEKAHPDVFNLLLQVMDEGRLTDSLGRRVDFKNTILIMTSNVGTRQLKEFGKGIGFAYPDSVQQKEYSKSLIHKAITKTFAPEFLNRIDDTVYFEQLSKESILKIIDLELDSFYQRVEALGYTLSITEKAKNFIGEKGYDVQFGARPLKRAIQKYLEDELAEVILGEKFTKNKHIQVELDTKDNKIILSDKAK